MSENRLSFGAAARLLDFLALMAVRLLHLREIARMAPERLATDVLPADLVQVVAHLAKVPPPQVTLGTFWSTVARRGGHQGRTGDGSPGWKTIWRGWLAIQQLIEGVHLAAHLPPQTDRMWVNVRAKAPGLYALRQGFRDRVSGFRSSAAERAV